MVTASRARPEVRSEGVALRTHDLAITLVGTLALAVLALHGRHVAGWAQAARNFALIASGPLLFRALEHRFPSPATRFLAAFVPPSLGVIFFYSNLDPLCDLLNPHLADASLAALDHHLFGVYPTVWLEHRVPRAAIEVLMLCYTSYYLWPVGIALVLFATGQERALERFSLGYVLVMFSTYACYLVVPAIGPRFYLASQLDGPLQGLWLTPTLDRLFRASPYFRDCFPSGHTALTLFCLMSARRLTPRFFKVMLLPGLGLIAATLVCRFHYAVDLMCGPLATAFAFAAADALQRRLPEVTLPVPLRAATRT